ncbi:MAG: DUF4401 domain-containing protein, partial [Sphingobacteriales bacterium]
SKESMIVMGVLLVAVTMLVSNFTDHRFFDGMATAMYLSGLTLIGLGLGNQEPALICILLMLIAAGGFFLMKNRLLLFLTVIVFCGSFLSLGLFPQVVPGLIYVALFLIITGYTLCSLTETLFYTSGNWISFRYKPLRSGLLFATAGALVAINYYPYLMMVAGYSIVTWIIVLLCIYVLVYRMSQDLGWTTPGTAVAIVTITVLLLPFLYFPSVPGSLLIILVSVHTRNRTGFAIGVLSFLYFISVYYYDLNLTLLMKSVILFSSGLLFLGSYLGFKKWIAR